MKRSAAGFPREMETKIPWFFHGFTPHLFCLDLLYLINWQEGLTNMTLFLWESEIIGYKLRVEMSLPWLHFFVKVCRVVKLPSEQSDQGNVFENSCIQIPFHIKFHDFFMHGKQINIFHIFQSLWEPCQGTAIIKDPSAPPAPRGREICQKNETTKWAASWQNQQNKCAPSED